MVGVRKKGLERAVLARVDEGRTGESIGRLTFVEFAAVGRRPNGEVREVAQIEARNEACLLSRELDEGPKRGQSGVGANRCIADDTY